MTKWLYDRDMHDSFFELVIVRGILDGKMRENYIIWKVIFGMN